MKFIYKILFICFCVTLLYSTSFAKNQKKKKKASTTIIAKKKKKSNKKEIARKNTNRNTAKANLAKLIKETSQPIEVIAADSIPEKTITILSAFKPQLKNLAKINFSNAIALNDTTSINLSYQVPSQNLNFEYRPIALVPRTYKVALPTFSKSNLSAKIGYGNNLHDFEELKYTTTDNKNNTHSFIVNNESYTGTKHHLQVLREVNAKYIGNWFINDKNALQTQLFYSTSQRYRYGLVADTSNYPISNYEQKINHFGMAMGWIHDDFMLHRLHLNPTLQLEQFQLNTSATNTSLVLNNPMYYDLKNGMILHFNNYINWSQYHQSGQSQQINKIIRLDPSFSINIKGFVTDIGANLVWGVNNKYNFYPAMGFTKQLKDTHYTITTGWKTNVTINTLEKMVSTNPWIMPYNSMNTTTDEHKFIQMSVVSNKRLHYGFGIATHDYRNLPFFNRIILNDNAKTGLRYQVIYEPRAITLDFNAHLNYQFSDNIILKNDFSYTQFNLIKENSKPWGILPLKMNSTLHWKPNELWSVQASGQFWSGAYEYRDVANPFSNKNAIILNAGFTYKLSSNWSMWAKGENLLDKPYERWADYPSLGLQLMGGVIYSFRK